MDWILRFSNQNQSLLNLNIKKHYCSVLCPAAGLCQLPQTAGPSGSPALHWARLRPCHPRHSACFHWNFQIKQLNDLRKKDGFIFINEGKKERNWRKKIAKDHGLMVMKQMSFSSPDSQVRGQQTSAASRRPIHLSSSLLTESHFNGRPPCVPLNKSTFPSLQCRQVAR